MYIVCYHGNPFLNPSLKSGCYGNILCVCVCVGVCMHTRALFNCAPGYQEFNGTFESMKLTVYNIVSVLGNHLCRVSI